MNRKFVYGLLSLPVVMCLVLLAIMPGETRATFLTEFNHRVRLMMGYEPKTYGDGEMGLRSEHPEEYGLDDDDADGEPSNDAFNDDGDSEHAEDAVNSDANFESEATADDSDAAADDIGEATVDAKSSVSE